MRPYFAIVCVAMLFAGFAGQATAQPSDALKVGPQGQIAVPAFSFPTSAVASPQMAKSFRDRLVQGEDVLKKWVVTAKSIYAVNIQPSHIAGVPVMIYTPKAGVPTQNAGLTLINLHGGGFNSCFAECSALESIPVAALSDIKVITIDYRQAPGNQFPAASQDVAAVYAELLKTQKPETIGLYGCSAGGMLVAESLAWFQAHHLPNPKAVGIFCAGGSPQIVGDSAIIGIMLGNATLAPSLKPGKNPQPAMGYFASANMKDPLVSPITSPAILAKFPPTLVISGTRDMLLSSALLLHEKLTDAGVPAELHVWEGGRHAFFYDPSVPESVEAAKVIVKFFHTNFGR